MGPGDAARWSIPLAAVSEQDRAGTCPTVSMGTHLGRAQPRELHATRNGPSQRRRDEFAGDRAAGEASMKSDTDCIFCKIVLGEKAVLQNL